MDKKIEIDPRKITLNELKVALSKLRLTPNGAEPRDNQKIEGEQESIHYQITKENSPKYPEIFCYVLRVRGSSEGGRQGLIGDFVKLLGNPEREFPANNLLKYDCLIWDAKTIE